MALGFWKRAEASPDRLALVTPAEEQISAGELLARSNRLVHGLRALGLRKGDNVAVVLENGAPMIELYLAVFQAGFYLTPINHHLAGPEIAYIVEDSDAKVFVASERFEEAVLKAAGAIRLPPSHRFAVGEVPGFRPFAEISEGQPDHLPEERCAGAVMNYTSGTTGRPKGVRRRLADLDPDVAGSLFAAFFGMFGVKPEDGNVHLCGSPLYHTAVMMFSGMSLHLGHTLLVMDKWTPERMLELVERYRVTTSHMVPTQFHRLLGLPDEVKSRYDLSSLRCMIHAAAPCPVETKRRMLEWWGPVIYEYYAATEGGGTLVTPEEWLAHPGTVGRAWPNSEIRILDDEGRDCPPGTPGTVYMRLGQNDFEYHKDRRKTEENRREGFFTVGDMGYLDEEGYLYLCDRKIDMIISGGVNIYPAEIEAALHQMPEIEDVAVFGVPNEDWGEEVKAVVKPVPGVEPGPDLAERILAFAGERLARYKIPKSIDFIDEMPRDPNGKLYKRRLRDPWWEGRQRAI